jgi:hypothetical protein
MKNWIWNEIFKRVFCYCLNCKDSDIYANVSTKRREKLSNRNNICIDFVSEFCVMKLQLILVCKLISKILATMHRPVSIILRKVQGKSTPSYSNTFKFHENGSLSLEAISFYASVDLQSKTSAANKLFSNSWCYLWSLSWFFEKTWVFTAKADLVGVNAVAIDGEKFWSFTASTTEFHQQKCSEELLKFLITFVYAIYAKVWKFKQFWRNI